ncbi:MAG: hypothetical protein ACO20F_08745 [Robiginitalea sp.]|jgi:hypothetical protein
MIRFFGQIRPRFASQFNAVLVSRMAHNRVTLTWFEPVLEEIDLLLEELEKN